MAPGPRDWKNLKNQRIDLPNGAVMELVPFDRHKGRHWRVTCDGAVIGEWKTWQQSIYTRQPKDTYGRGGGTYRTEMMRESWLQGLEEPSQPSDRHFREFRALASRYPEHRRPVVRRIKKAAASQSLPA